MRDLLSGLLALLIAFGGGYWYGKSVEKDAQQAEVFDAASLSRLVK